MLYLEMSFHSFGHSRIPVVEHFRGEAAESMQHAILIGEKIVTLGGTPTVVAPRPKMPKGRTIDDFLMAAVANEKAAVKVYSELLELVPDDTALRVMLEDQVAAENEHLEEVSKMLRR